MPDADIRDLPVTDLTPAAFAPYGSVVPPTQDGARSAQGTQPCASAAEPLASTPCGCRTAGWSSAASPGTAK